MSQRCPGTDSRYLELENSRCMNCGYEVEFFSDETVSVCPGCGKSVRRDKKASCADWCEYAKECLGEQKWLRLKGGEIKKGKV